MNKMEYQKPWAEFVEFSNEDIITASGTCPFNSGSWCPHPNHPKCNNEGGWVEGECDIHKNDLPGGGSDYSVQSDDWSIVDGTQFSKDEWFGW